MLKSNKYSKIKQLGLMQGKPTAYLLSDGSILYLLLHEEIAPGAK